MFFYLFSILILLAALGVVMSKNPVHSVLWLICAFINSAGIFILLGAEFLAMMMIIVYVGAVAVLFLFVVMMLDVDFEAVVKPARSTLIQGVLICTGLISNISIMILSNLYGEAMTGRSSYKIDTKSALTNTEMIGSVLYSDFILPFQLAGIILFIAIVGAITLTVRKTNSMKRQNVRTQLNRDKKSSIKLVHIPNNSPVKGINYDI
jgi:NADH-quinone oxidoreductase subunit J